MFKNYVQIAIRNLFRQKTYSIINIVGLSIGLMACLFIVLYIIDEFQYDRHHEKGKNIYRMVVEYTSPSGGLFPIPIQAYRLRDALVEEYPQMEKISRITMPYDATVEFEDDRHELYISAVDDDYLDMFNLEMVEGDKYSGLSGPDHMMISVSSAKKIFGDEPAMGKYISMYADGETYPVKVSGVFEDFPRTSHIHFDAIFSTRVTDNIFNERQLKNWGEGSCFVYVMIPEYEDISKIEESFPAFVEKHRGEGSSESVDYRLQPLFDIHLRSNLRYEAEANGDIRYVYIFGIVALFILLIATFNYMNLSTARSMRRSREVGVRKVSGASKSQLLLQFLGEAVIVTFFAMWLAILLSELFLPFFNDLSGKELQINVFNDWKLLALLVLTSVVIGVLAGTYPAFFLSRFKPIHTLSGTTGSEKASNSVLRKSLVVLQFSISIALIISTLIIFAQWKYMSNAKLGIQPENIVVLPVPSEEYRTYKQEILQDPAVLSVSALNKKPTRELSSNLNFKAEGMENPDDASIKLVTVEWDFFETIGNKIVEGRSFSKEFGSDEREAFILNEAAVKYIGWDNAVGKWFETSTLDSAGVNWVSRKGRVIGVAEDFYFESLHNEIRPVAYFIQENWINWMLVKISGNNMQRTISFLGDKWREFNSEEEFSYSFYENDIENLYFNERRIFKLFISFAILAVFIASLGILGLVSYTAEQRTKEIGIRKVMGANTSVIIKLLTFDFMKLVVLANIIAWPVAWYFMKQWLTDFPKRVDITIWFFVLAAFLAVLIALTTTLYQAWNAARSNPSNALKYE